MFSKTSWRRLERRSWRGGIVTLSNTCTRLKTLIKSETETSSSINWIWTFFKSGCTILGKNKIVYKIVTSSLTSFSLRLNISSNHNWISCREKGCSQGVAFILLLFVFLFSFINVLLNEQNFFLLFFYFL